MLGALFTRNLEALKRPVMDTDDTDVQVTETRLQSTTAGGEASHGPSKAAVKTTTTTTEGASPASVSTENDEAQDSDASEEQDGGEEQDEEEDDDSDDDVDKRANDLLPPSFTTSVIVTVHVGPKRKCFYLHRTLICERSPFMEKCLSKNRFSEGDKNELYLPEDDPKAFAIVVDWIYRGKLPSLVPGVGGVDVLDMTSAYCMADKFGMEELQNGIIDAVRASHRVAHQHHLHTHGHNHTHCTMSGHSSGSSRDASRLGLISSLTSGPGDRDTSAAPTSPESTRPNYSALAVCHLTGPPKSPLKRFFIEQLVYHMMTFPRWYHNDFTKNHPSSSKMATKSPAAADDPRAVRDRENFDKLFETADLSLLIMRKIWQWQIERWGDPARDRGCAYHVHSSTQCEYKKAGIGSTSGISGTKPSVRGGLSSNPNHSTTLLQGLGSTSRAQANWMGGSSVATTGLIGGWHPGVGW
ncbi:hypothetical protein G647_01930 [Cladophialophora carrionii CBS 160.54]|uniref:BTB domain-containing protein n=1 Tax=Cladophialophora carrionii CBS 160.54 TaxID=1279043 RepID=V9DU07_9EURO|nr:uncharacterized protein G647_01930 [Cladophialophora carrionii CBS 160.54]ETI29477.1 hypothetical protein G647_01930 [Cladophialophora carrionii CBS 160.54]